MSATLLHFTMSLDGCIADEHGSIDWAFGFGPAVLPEADRIRTRATVVVGGRRGYDVDPAAQPYGGDWNGTVMVLSHRPAPPDADPATVFLDASIDDALRAAHARAEGGDVLLLSADLARQALDADLVDEILLHVVPVALGRGIRLFDGLAAPRRFRTALTAQSGEVTTLLLRRAADGDCASLG
ncbi:dihydrofolate reductase family protein [Schumannella sp. 10F1B-5-1]|uniref:dihydrofolate reductase family protein n=1 Tax=Schumannella sp. 10F1B-5-1 TaxID=2590780 RepID=UPI001131CE97|nr:dihydrofolate reductase family protein [Schumannella sp. 10F1B-5-1]TPW70910.1 dihydrofolate reductase [Schumannella sp. 10F1B-5-1]